VKIILSRYYLVLFFFNFYIVFILVKIIGTLFEMKIFRKSPIKNSILYLENLPSDNAGYQYRAAKWMELLRKEGYQVDIWTLYEDIREFKTKITEKPFSKFLTFALKKRFRQVLASLKYETVIVRRELLWFNDYGNLFIDKLLLKFHPNAILDFDDDIAAAKSHPKKITNWYARLMGEHGNKFNESLRMYKRFIVASNYLKERVIEENPNIDPNNINVIPTCVDYDKYPPKNYPEKGKKITFGWIGGDHNYCLLDLLLPIFNHLAEKYSFKLLVIGGFPYVRDTKFQIEFRKWGLSSEVDDMYSIDIGIMPLSNNEESKGKGGFKLIQYMGLGIVSVATPITVNTEIVADEIDSILVMSEIEWENAFIKILKGDIDLVEMGKKARLKIERNYTFNANQNKYLDFIEYVRNSRNMV
jgi:glycosyltransferase involved in cell wall biosynthesis